MDLNNMITYDLRIKFDPLVFALKRKADASLVDKLRTDLASVMTTLGAQTTQLDMMKRMVDGGGGASTGSSDGKSEGTGGGTAILMEMAASIGTISTELKALREQRASDAAHIEELQRSTGLGGGHDGYSISDQLTDRISALEANIASVLKKVSRELSRNSSAASLTPITADVSVDSPVASPPANVSKGYDYGSEIRKLADRLESLVAEVVPVGSLAREALELAKSATKSAEAASLRANNAETAASQALSSAHSVSGNGLDTAALAAAAAAASAHNGDKSSVDLSALSAQISSLHARLEQLSKKQAEDGINAKSLSDAEKASRSNDLSALRDELMNAMKLQADQFSTRLSETAAAVRSSAASNAGSPASSIGSPSHISSPRPTGVSGGATLDSLASRIDIVTARVASTETGLATTAKALVGLKNNVEALATHQVLVGSTDSSNIGTTTSTSIEQGGHGRSISTTNNNTHGASHRSSSTSSGIAGMDEGQFKQWAEAVTSSIAILSGIDESVQTSGGDVTTQGNTSTSSSIAMTRLLERAASLSASARPSATQADVKTVHSTLEGIEERLRLLSSTDSKTSSSSSSSSITELEVKVASIKELKADRDDIDIKLASITSSLASLQDRVEGVLLQMAELAKVRLANGGQTGETGSPTHKDRAALSGRPLLRDLKCLSCDQPLAHGLPPEAGGQGPRDVMIPHLPISKAWMFSQTGGSALMPQAQGHGLGIGGGHGQGHGQGSMILNSRSSSPQSLGGGGSAFTMLPNGHVIQRSVTAIGSQRATSSGGVTLPALI
jgi:hypothetical protein